MRTCRGSCECKSALFSTERYKSGESSKKKYQYVCVQSTPYRCKMRLLVSCPPPPGQLVIGRSDIVSSIHRSNGILFVEYNFQQVELYVQGQSSTVGGWFILLTSKHEQTICLCVLTPESRSPSFSSWRTCCRSTSRAPKRTFGEKLSWQPCRRPPSSCIRSFPISNAATRPLGVFLTSIPSCTL